MAGKHPVLACISVHQIMVFGTLNTGCLEIQEKKGNSLIFRDFPDFCDFL